uniref:Transposase n=1 Tax=Verticillium dahliae TaxID=27337 RepID=G8GKM6_VERDA|nr:transposase [Verticillium dahliae]
MPRYTEDEINQALEAIINGQSIKSASTEWGIPRTTLNNRLQGQQPRDIAFSTQQKLSPTQEKHLVEWIRIQAALGLPPTHSQIREFAERILHLQGGPQTIGKNWFQAFTRRNPSIKVQRARPIDSQRINGATTNVIRDWFRYLSIPEIKAIQPVNRYNMDETGILEGRGSNGLVLGSAEAQNLRKKQPGSRAWTSILECISATGTTVPPLVIFKGKSVQQQWFPLDLQPYSSWKFTATENGWTDNDTAVFWLKEIFIPSTQPTNPSTARLLILDGHGSHETTEFMYLCYTNNIHLVFLPPHTSHVLQPLDQSVFGPLKAAYRKELGYLEQWNDSTVVGKRNFLACYRKARQSAFTAQNIRSGWKSTGLWPVSMTWPFLSPLLLENSTNATRSVKSTLDRAIGSRAIQQYETATSAVTWSTPRKTVDLQVQLAQFNQLDQPTNTQRLLFRKVRKGFEKKDYLIATQQRRIQVLEQQLGEARPRKKKKVRISPNSKFADIEAIHRAQIEAGDKEDNIGEISDLEIPSDPEDCIVVASERVENSG